MERRGRVEIEVEDLAAELAGEALSVATMESWSAEEDRGVRPAARDEMRELAKEASSRREEPGRDAAHALDAIVDGRRCEGASKFGGGLEERRAEGAQRVAVGVAALGEDDNEE